MCKSFTLLSATLLSFSSIITQAQQLNTAKLDSLFNSLTSNKKMMGSLALSPNGKMVYSRAFGSLQTDNTASFPPLPPRATVWAPSARCSRPR
jgi:hypothetical protein